MQFVLLEIKQCNNKYENLISFIKSLEYTLNLKGDENFLNEYILDKE